MIKRLISFLLTLVLFIAIPLEARYRYNPYTRKLDWYEAAADVDLGDLGDITLTGLANGDILYYNGTAWVNLVAGANTNVLTLAAGIPSWAAPGAPAAHAPTHLAAGADPVDHDQLLNYLAAQHLTLPNTLVAVLTDHNAAAHVALGFLALPSTIAAVLTDHNLLAHTALGLFDQSSDVDHDATTNYLAAQHLTLPSTIAAVLTDHNQAAHNALLIDADTVDGEHAAAIVTNARVKAHFPDTIANVLSDHNLLAHTALGLFDQSSDVDHNATTNYFIYNHVGEDHIVDHNIWIGWLAGQNLAVGGQYNTLVGEQAGTDLTTGDNNVAVGYQALFETATGGSNTAVGYQALLGSAAASNFSNNVAIGFQAGFELQSAGINNTFGGYQSGYNEQTGHDLTYYGYKAGFTTNPNGGSSYNTAIGAESGYFLATGASNNSFLGRHSGYNTTNGLGNVAAGVSALYGNQEGDYNVAVGYGAGLGTGTTDHFYNVFVGQKAGWAVTTGSYNVFVGTSAGEDLTTGTYNIAIGYYAGEGWLDDETYKLIIDVSDTTTPLIYGDFTADNITINGDFNITMDAALDQVLIAQSATGGTEDQALVRITDNREGATVDEKGEAVLSINAYEAWALYVQKGTSQFDDDTIMTSDVFVTWNDVLDKMVISQSSATGTEDQPLIYINDDRTGATANEYSEATLYLDALGEYALTIIDGLAYIGGASGMRVDGYITMFDDRNINIGTNFDINLYWDTNGAADDIYTIQFRAASGAGTNAIFLADLLSPNGMTDHDNYKSPTWAIANKMGADANDYAGVVIGERTQADVKVAHYFDFYAMTGAVDGSPDPANAELAAIFRFGASGTAVPGYSTTGGDVLLEGSLEIDGNQQNAGYNRYDYIYWIESFDHGIAANRYSQMWDITSLNTQGNGTNTIDTTPSHITLTTDNNAIGDNEGTITYKQIILRSRLNRSEFSVDLGQTANTQFYCGWNTSQTNAMVAAADEYVIVFFDVSDNANWQIKVGDGATEDVFTSAVAGDTNEIRHEIWVEADGTVHWRVNGTELDITGSVDNLMTANGHYLIVCQAQSVTGAAAIVAEMCYVENEKTKAN